eukprot:scaffold45914_cov24-Phaeocystis_antarctica.AAC.1
MERVLAWPLAASTQYMLVRWISPVVSWLSPTAPSSAQHWGECGGGGAEAAEAAGAAEALECARTVACAAPRASASASDGASPGSC